MAAIAIITTALANCGSNYNPTQKAKTTEEKAEARIEVSTDEACQKPYVSVKMDTFENCLTEGLTYVQVANTLGYAGTLMTQSGNTEAWQWNDGEGKYLTVLFIDRRLASKSQINLE